MPAEGAVAVEAAVVAAGCEAAVEAVVAAAREVAAAVVVACGAADRQGLRLSSRARCFAAGRPLRCTVAASPVVC